MAMQHEAAPIIEKFGLQPLNAFEIGLLGPMLPYHAAIQIGETKGDLYLLLNGESHVREQCGYEEDGLSVFIVHASSTLLF